MSNHKFAVYTANVAAPGNVPVSGAPTNAMGMEVFAETLQVPVGGAVEIDFDATMMQTSGTTALSVSWFLDDEVNARRTAAFNHIGGGYLALARLHDVFEPGDGLPHTYRIRVGAAPATSGGSSAVLNGGTPGGAVYYGGTLQSSLLLKEL